MPKRSRKQQILHRGEIWIVNFNSPISAQTPSPGSPNSKWPTTGHEIAKPRPAVVLNVSAAWELDLHIVVPLRRWRSRFEKNNYFWIVRLHKDTLNKLTNDTGADTFQVKSVSRERFQHRIGVVTNDQLRLLLATVAYCIGYSP